MNVQKRIRLLRHLQLVWAVLFLSCTPRIDYEKPIEVRDVPPGARTQIYATILEHNDSQTECRIAIQGGVLALVQFANKYFDNDPFTTSVTFKMFQTTIAGTVQDGYTGEWRHFFFANQDSVDAQAMVYYHEPGGGRVEVFNLDLELVCP